MSDVPVIAAGRIVVILPNWLGDGVMATPFLRALRGVYPGARIAGVGRPVVGELLAGDGVLDDVHTYARGGEGGAVRWMRGEGFELGVLLPNSFRAAWMLWRGGVRRRLGYARGGRSILLTDGLRAAGRSVGQRAADRGRAAAIRRLGGGRVRVGSGFEPVPTIDYYLELARHLGAAHADRRMALRTTEEDERAADEALGQLGIRESGRERIEDRKSKIENLIVLVPGANFGSSKCWLPERFAAVAEALADPGGAFGGRVILAGTPGEAAICGAIAGAMGAQRERVGILSSLNGGAGVSVGVLKAIIRRARLMVCNDTGPRHMAAAFGVPTVTLFGPTNPVWAETYSAVERVVRVEVACGPCQLKACPIDHRCMTGVTVERVMGAVREVWPMSNGQ